MLGLDADQEAEGGGRRFDQPTVAPSGTRMMLPIRRFMIPLPACHDSGCGCRLRTS